MGDDSDLITESSPCRLTRVRGTDAQQQGRHSLLSRTRWDQLEQDCCAGPARPPGHWDRLGSLTLGARLEEDKKLESSGTISARDIFKNKDKMGISELETRLNTTHQNQISELRIHEGNKDNVTTISTVAGDGKLVIWNIKTLASKMANLKI